MSSQQKLRRGFAVPMVLGIFLALLWTFIASPVQGAAQTAPAASAYSQGTPPVACDHTDAPDKGWIQIFYVYREGANRLDQKRDTIRRFVWDVDQLFDASALRFGHGDSRRLRFVQDADCQIVVTPIAVSGLPAQTNFGQVGPLADKVVDQQVVKGDVSWSNRHKKIYLMDIDGIDGCGVGGGSGLGNLGGGFVSLAPACWGAAGLEHEMGHSFGLSHCNEDHTQGNDPMCRGYDSTPRCNEVMATVFLDCPRDEFAYFNPRPAPGSVLAVNPGQNIANSPYLIKNQPAPPVDARLVDLVSNKCLTSGGAGQPVVAKACDGSDVWRRTIGSDGYFRLELSSTGQCLSSTPTDTKMLVTQACADGDQQQHWYFDDAPDGAAGDFYGLVNQATQQREGTKERIDNGGPWQFGMHFLSSVPAASPAPSATSHLVPTKNAASPSKSSAAQNTAATTAAPAAVATDNGSSTPAARADTHLAKTGFDTITGLATGAGAVALAAFGTVLVLRARRRSVASSGRRR